MVQTLCDAARERNVELTADLDDSLDAMWIDPEVFYDAMLNLVTNAMEAIPDDRSGHVVIRTRRLDGRSQAVIEVVDDGAGIPEEIRDKIFNLFFSTNGQKGTGIGLAATRRILEDHGGSVDFESADGNGTTFRIFMPLTSPDARPSVQEPRQLENA
jgi:signal transduction histidine kinase